MSALYDLAKSSARGAVQTVLCGAGGAVRAGDDLNEKLNPLYRGSPLDRLADRVGDGLTNFCPVPPPPVTLPPSKPFEGGQCPEVLYEVTGFTQGNSQTEPTPFGPIVRVGPVGINQTFSQDGNPSQFFVVSRAGQPNESQRLIGSGSGGLTSVVRRDGAPDTCGDPPAPVDPDRPPPTSPIVPDIDVDITLPGIGPVTVTVGPVVGIVYTDIDANIKVPVKINITGPQLEFSPSFYFDVDISNPDNEPTPITPLPPETPDGRPTQPDCPLPPGCGEEPVIRDDDEGDDDEDDEKGRKTVGAVVLSTRTSGTALQTELLAERGPSLWIPYIGLVTVVYETPEGNLVYSEDIRVKRVRQVVEVPNVGLDVAAVLCNWETGWTGEVLLIRKELECNG